MGLSLSERLKGDRDIALAAFLNGHARHCDLPEHLSRNRAFFIDAVKQDSSSWYNLPDDYQRDPEFVLNIKFSYDTHQLVDEIFETIPSLRIDRRFLDKIISSSFDEIEWSIETAPAIIRSDRELMMKACFNNHDSLCYVDESLALDRDFMYEVIENNTMAAWSLSHVTQRMFPELLLDNLQELIAYYEDQELILDRVSPEIRTSPSFVKA